MGRDEAEPYPRVYCRNGTGYWWRAFPMSWHERAETGMDIYGCYVWARVEGAFLRVQHGPDPEQSRLFTPDELNKIGKCHEDPDPVHLWFEQIHTYLDGRRRGSGRTDGS